MTSPTRRPLDPSPEEIAAARGRLDDLVGQAIGVLTLIARQTRVRGSGTAATVEPVDFADLTAQVLTSVAANLGSVETLLAGRPGSWEADLVRRLVDGTAGDAGEVQWRTEPVRLALDADDVLYDFGIGDLYEQERDHAAEATHDGDLTDEQRDTAENLVDAIESLWEQDQAAYVEAYRATALRYLAEHGATCGVEIVAAPWPHPDPLRWDGLAERIDEYAREHTPLPMTGGTPDWSEGSPADALRRAGLTYTARAGEPKCGRCSRLFDPTDKSFNGAARYGNSPFCRGCVDRCHESTDAFHQCPVCAG